ncbi:flocculation protein FLO1 [Spatholobus suberectus]|nr:flocculation protein FLO1 [Spatholobus suberectus]
MAGKQSKARKPEVFGKGKVTPTQIAFIVDRYLCDNNFCSTRSTFRNEASSLIANSPIHEAPKSLLTLGEMLDEYICLKEQKVMLDQERVIVEQEKNRVQMLLQGMQNVMTAYNASGNLQAPAAKSAVVAVPQPTFSYKSHPGNPTSVQNKSNTLSLPQSSNSNAEGGTFSTPTMNVSDRKRKDTKAVDAPSAAKKSRGRSSSRKIVVQGQNALQQSDNAVSNTVVAQPSAIQSSSENCIPRESQVQGSNVAKCLFNQSTPSVPSNSPVPKTPRRTKPSHSDTRISPSEISSVATCNRAVTPSRCTVISTKRVMVSPAKQMAYIEMSHCISPVKKNSEKVSKRDHVRSRLNFDASDVPESLDNPLTNEISTSESEKELEIFDIDFPNFDALGMDFSFTEMLNDLDFSCEGMDFSCHPTSSASMDNASGSSHECNGNHATPELSTVAEVRCEKDMKILGPDCLTAMKSVTKSITVISPEKNRQLSVDEENCT